MGGSGGEGGGVSPRDRGGDLQADVAYATSSCEGDGLGQGGTWASGSDYRRGPAAIPEGMPGTGIRTGLSFSLEPETL